MLDLVLSDLGVEWVRVDAAAGPLVPPDGYHPPLAVSLFMPRVAPTTSIAQPSPRARPGACPEWNFRGADFSALYEALTDLDWTELLLTSDVNTAVDIFYEKLYACIDVHVPVKKPYRPASRYVYPKWYTTEIIKNIKNKYFHFKRYKTEGKEFNKQLYRYYRGHVKFLIDNAYNKYISSTERSITNDPTKFWDYIKDRRRDRQRCEVFTCDNVEVSGQDAVDAFSRYFSSVFQTEVPRLDAREAERAAQSIANATRIAIDSIDETDLVAAIKRLKPRSSSGPDGIPAFLVKDCVSVMKIPLLHLYSLSLEQSTYPKRWKTTRVTPVPKGGAGNDVTNYRPIAVLSVFGKVFEAILDSRIGQQVRNVMSNCQHGFRGARSTNTNHINLVDYIAARMDAGGQVDAAYFDFRKAFDLVDNDVLLRKFAELGFTPKLLELFASYLRNRKQYVKLGRYVSEDYYTRSGVSQGSTLGPLQFLLMINDLPDVVSASKCLLFADDLKLYLNINGVSDAKILQRDIDAVERWSVENRLPFNTSKCKVITFSRKRLPLQFSYTLGNVPLDRVGEIRDLGLALTDKLDFHSHMTDICKSANRTLGFLMRTASQFTDSTVAVVLYNAYVRSKLEFGCLIWDPYESKYALMVEKVQKKFARWLYKRRYGYYPFLYPSMFVSGMVGLDTLVVRRKLLLVAHYYHLLHNKVDNPTALAQMGLTVPHGGTRSRDGSVAPRRMPRTFSLPVTHSHRAANAPTARARRLLGTLLARNKNIDVFADGVGTFLKESYLELCQLY